MIVEGSDSVHPEGSMRTLLALYCLFLCGLAGSDGLFRQTVCMVVVGGTKSQSDDATLFAFTLELFPNELTSKIGHDERWKAVFCEYACEMV